MGRHRGALGLLLPLLLGGLGQGFGGKNWEINVDDCPGHKCRNGGTCVDGVNTYSCRCAPEFTGQFCTEDVDECRLQPNPCHNGGTCSNTHGGHTCVCVNGWTGKSCSENIDDCANAVCFNGATCHDRVASFYCECPMGKTGLLCHLDDQCIRNPCHKKAICDINPVNGRVICSCPPGLTGGACDQDVDECSIGANPCEHFGKCVNTQGSFQCQCGKGYTGPRCQTDINECLSMPCQNNASCVDRIGGFTCICMSAGLLNTHGKIITRTRTARKILGSKNKFYTGQCVSQREDNDGALEGDTAVPEVASSDSGESGEAVRN
ncbi:uncharacterized protein LOC144758218 [Lissotriton helveticus]